MDLDHSLGFAGVIMLVLGLGIGLFFFLIFVRKAYKL